MPLKDFAEIADHLATVVALLIGGGWVLYQYVIRRSGESGLSIDLKAQTSEWKPESKLAFVDVVLRNTGQRCIDATTDSPSSLEQQFEGSIRYAGSLQLRKLNSQASGAVAHIDWWDKSSGWLAQPIVPETDLLKEYTDQEGTVEFFMEPGEEYHLGNVFILEPGIYLAKIVFVGQRKAEFWGRIIKIDVS